MNDLEEAKAQGEEADPTPTEGEESTQGKVEPTVRTYSQKEHDTALGKGLASTNAKLSAETAAKDAALASATTVEAELQTLQDKHDELVQKQFADDPDAKQAYTDRRAITDEKRALAKEKTEVAGQLLEAKKLALSAVLTTKSAALVSETGIGASELEDCKTEAEMEVKALRFKLTKQPGKAEESEETPKFDQSVPSGSGMPANPTTEQLNEMAEKHPVQYEKWAAARYK